MPGDVDRRPVGSRKTEDAGLVPVGAEAKVVCDLGPVVVRSVKDDTLTLTERPKQGSLERSGSKKDLTAITVTQYDADAGFRVIYLDDTLHAQAFSIFPALIHDVQTRMRLELLPCLTRTR